MRHIAWLSGLLLIVSCSINPVLNVDGSPSGGGGTNGGGGQGGATTGNGGAGGDHAGGRSGNAGGTAGTSGGTAGSSGGTSGTAGTSGSGGSSVAGHDGGGHGGHGTGKDGGETCAELETDYSNAFAPADKCTPGAANQCQQLISTSLPCPGCKVYVNDPTMLNAIADTWESQGCGTNQIACPAIACVNPVPSFCAGTNSPACQAGVLTTN